MTKLNVSATVSLAILFVTAGLAAGAPAPAAPEAATGYKPAPMPYPENALEPVITEKTVQFHYGKHHKGYADKLNDLVKGTPLADKKIEELITLSANQPDKVALFNNAAQVWNHDFFWASMKPGGGGTPTGKLADMIKESFGSFEEFKKQFIDTAMSQFGSGWTWLVIDGKNLKILKTGNADTPITQGLKPLICLDVWEHAYYLDYQNRRKDFATVFLDKLVNWDFAAARLAGK